MPILSVSRSRLSGSAVFASTYRSASVGSRPGSRSYAAQKSASALAEDTVPPSSDSTCSDDRIETSPRYCCASGRCACRDHALA